MFSVLARIAELASLPFNVVAVLGAIWGTLILGTGIRFLATWRSIPERRQQRLLSLRSWWILLGLVTIALCLGKIGVALFFALFSVLGLREFLRLPCPQGSPGERHLVLTFAAVHFAFLLVLPGHVAQWSAIVLATMLIAGRSAALGQIPGFARGVGVLCWSFVHAVIFPSFAVLLHVKSGLVPCRPGYSSE